MSIPINQVIAFSTVARTGSFAEAAIQLHLSPPALSIAIKNLEESLGGKLLARTTRSVALTPEGKAFYPVARRLLSDWEQSLQDVRNHFALRRGKLDIAAMPTYTTNLLPQILANFHRQYPDINVTVHDVIAESVVEMVSEGLGLSVVPSTGRAQMEEMGRQSRAISSPVITHQLGVITRRQQELSAAAQAMEALIRTASTLPC